MRKNQNLYGMVGNSTIGNWDYLGFGLFAEVGLKNIKKKAAQIRKYYRQGELAKAAKVAEKMYSLIALGGAIKGYKMASLFMNMWLNESRGTYRYDLNKSQMRQVMKNAVVRDSLVEAFIKLNKEREKLTRERLRPIKTSYIGGTIPDKDIHYALGEFSFYFSGTYCIKNKRERKRKVAVSGTFELFDIYDWRNNGGKSIDLMGEVILDDWADNVEKHGLARAFLVGGKITYLYRVIEQHKPDFL